jgi:hypothetical protein
MAIVLFIGFGFAALRNADEFWASATFTLAIVTISAAGVGAIARKGRMRMPWAGFTVFGWAYLLVDLLPPRPDGGFANGPIPRPLLLIEWGIARLQPYINPSSLGGTPTPGGLSLFPYDQVSHSLGIILFGLIGAVLGRLLAVKDERPNS